MPTDAPNSPRSKEDAPILQDPMALMKRKKELLAKVRVLRERAMRGGDLEGLNPAKIYMWVNVKDARQTFFQAWGYVRVEDDKIKSPWRKADNTHQRADLILYEIDREIWEAIQADNQLRGLEGIEGHKQAAISAFHREGVREFIPAT